MNLEFYYIVIDNNTYNFLIRFTVTFILFIIISFYSIIYLKC